MYSFATVFLYHCQEMNMTGTGLALTHDRAEALDFSEYLYLEESSAAYKRPVLQPDVAGFLRPFTGYVSLEALLILFHFIFICLVSHIYNYFLCISCNNVFWILTS